MGAKRWFLRAPVVLGLGGLALAAGCSSDPGGGGGSGGHEGPPMHPSWRRARLAALEHEGRRVEIVDVEFGESVGLLELPATARAAAVSDSGEHLLVATDAGATVVYAGIALLDHSEGSSDSSQAHIHVYKFDPALVELELEEAPSPAVAAQAGVFAAVYASGTSAGHALCFEESALYEDAPVELRRVDGMKTGAGAALPLGGGLLFETEAGIAWAPTSEATAVPTPLRECASVGARAGLGGLALVQCDGALVRFESSDGAPSASTVNLPFELEAGTELALHPEGSAVAVYGPSGAWAVPLQAGAAAPTPLTTPERACDLGFEPGHGATITALTEAGVLYQLDAQSGEVLHERAVAEPFACADAPRPTLAQAPARAYVALPGARRIDELWLDDALAPLGSYPLSVAPARLYVVGIDRATRNLGDLSDVQ